MDKFDVGTDDKQHHDPTHLRQFRSVLCVDGCGALGNPQTKFLCEECIEERLVRRAAKEMIRKRESDGEAVRAAGSNKVFHDGMKLMGKYKDAIGLQQKKVLNLVKSKQSSNIMKEFFERPRQKDAESISRELGEFTKQQKTRRIAMMQMRKYMIATNKGEVPDIKIWTRYKYDAPGKLVDLTDSSGTLNTNVKSIAKHILSKKKEFLIKATAKLQ